MLAPLRCTQMTCVTSRVDAPARTSTRIASPPLAGLIGPGLTRRNPRYARAAGDDVNERRPDGYHRVTLAGPCAGAYSPMPLQHSPRQQRRKRIEPLAWLLPGGNPAGVVYGTVTVGALLAAESGLRDTYPETVGSLVVAVALYWFAHSYADVLGLRLTRRARLTGSELWHAFVQDWAIVRGAAAPIAAVAIAWTLGAAQTTAVSAGVWTAVASLVIFEVVAGLRSNAKPPELALQVGAGLVLGLGVLALRALLH